MKDQIKEILKCALNNYIGVFMMVSSLAMILVGIKTGLLIGLFSDIFWMWLVTEIVYFVICRIIKFIKKINKRNNENE